MKFLERPPSPEAVLFRRSRATRNLGERISLLIPTQRVFSKRKSRSAAFPPMMNCGEECCEACAAQVVDSVANDPLRVPGAAARGDGAGGRARRLLRFPRHVRPQRPER